MTTRQQRLGIELGAEPAAPAAGPARLPFNADAADVLARFKPPVVGFHFGLPSPELPARVRGWGAKILASTTTLGCREVPAAVLTRELAGLR
jgi:hypothetical protein